MWAAGSQEEAFVAVAAPPVFDSGPEVIKPGVGERARRARRAVSIPVEGANLLAIGPLVNRVKGLTLRSVAAGVPPGQHPRGDRSYAIGLGVLAASGSDAGLLALTEALAG